MARILSRILCLDELAPEPPPPPRPPVVEPAWQARLRHVPFVAWVGLCAVLLPVSPPLCVFVVTLLSVWKLLSRMTVSATDAGSRPRRARHRLPSLTQVHPNLILDESGWIGLEGEKRVLQCLGDLGDDFLILHDVNVPTASGSTQLDLVVLSPRGIWVLEVKAWAGRIYGREDEFSWTQVKLYGRDVYRDRRENPVQQNTYHCHALREYLTRQGITAPVQSIVVFTEAELWTETQSLVVNLHSLVPIIRTGGGEVCLTPEQVRQIAALLRPLLPDPAQRPYLPSVSTTWPETGLPAQERRPRLLPTHPPPIAAGRPVGLGLSLAVRLLLGLVKAALGVLALLFVLAMLTWAYGVFGRLGVALGQGGSASHSVGLPIEGMLPLALLLGVVIILRALVPSRRQRRRR